jgi:hypothetical protein
MKNREGRSVPAGPFGSSRSGVLTPAAGNQVRTVLRTGPKTAVAISTKSPPRDAKLRAVVASRHAAPREGRLAGRASREE